MSEERAGIVKIFDLQFLTDLHHTLGYPEYDIAIFTKCTSVFDTNFVPVLVQKLMYGIA